MAAITSSQPTKCCYLVSENEAASLSSWSTVHRTCLDVMLRLWRYINHLITYGAIQICFVLYCIVLYNRQSRQSDVNGVNGVSLTFKWHWNCKFFLHCCIFYTVVVEIIKPSNVSDRDLDLQVTWRYGSRDHSTHCMWLPIDECVHLYWPYRPIWYCALSVIIFYFFMCFTIIMIDE